MVTGTVFVESLMETRDICDIYGVWKKVCTDNKLLLLDRIIKTRQGLFYKTVNLSTFQWSNFIETNSYYYEIYKQRNNKNKLLTGDILKIKCNFLHSPPTTW